jgi:hypothetical protein
MSGSRAGGARRAPLLRAAVAVAVVAAAGFTGCTRGKEADTATAPSTASSAQAASAASVPAPAASAGRLSLPAGLDLPPGAVAEIGARVRALGCTGAAQGLYASDARARQSMAVLAIECRQDDPATRGTEEGAQRFLRYLEYPLVLVVREGRLYEVTLPPFMYESGTIVAVTDADRDGWPEFELTGTVYECDEPEPDPKAPPCESEGTRHLVFRDGVLHDPAEEAAAAAASASAAASR